MNRIALPCHFSFLGKTENLPPESTIGRLFFDRVNTNRNKPFLSYRTDQINVDESWQEFSQRVYFFISLLKNMSVQKADFVALCADNSPNMLASIFAIQAIGAVCCPIHTTLSTVQRLELCKNYPYKVILTSKKEGTKFPPIASVPMVIMQETTLPPHNPDPIAISEIELDLNAVKPADLAYIILSSGTTGSQKGVMLTHDNIMTNQRQVLSMLSLLDTQERYLTCLPLSHSFGGLAELYQALYVGAEYVICPSRDINVIIASLIKNRPTVFQSVPRVWEKLYHYMLDPKYETETNDLKKVFKFMKMGFSAGASINMQVLRYFYKCGLDIYQGYGLTECSPSIAIATPEDFILQKRYNILPEITAKSLKDKELGVKGPNVMQGYYKIKNHSDYFEENYLKTGDIVDLSKDNKYISVLGRMNDVIVLSNGEKVIPGEIENKLNECNLINQAVLVGSNRPFISCLISLNVDNNDVVKLQLSEIIENINKTLSKPEQIKKYMVVSSSTIENTTTITQKVKRKLLETEYEGLIDSFYL